VRRRPGRPGEGPFTHVSDPIDEGDAVRAALAGEAAAAAAEVHATQPEPDPSAAAFFDVDNTIMRGASIYHFARGLAARKLFHPRDLAKFAFGEIFFRVSGSENAE